MNNDIRFYLSLFLRRLPLFTLVAVTFGAMGVAVAMLTPTKYAAEALLLMESPQIPDQLAASTVQTNAREQLEIIEQRLLTRANLIDIADEFNVFPNRAEMFPDDIVEKMRKSTDFEITTGRDRATLFRVKFSSGDPVITAGVVNDYVTRILESNVELRTDRAEDTMDFFEAEVTRLSQELERQSQRILEFKNSNIDALPESMDYRLSRQTAMQERLATIERDLTALQDQRERAIMLYTASGGSVDQRADNRSSAKRELDALTNELDNALAIYSEQNPRVKVLKSRIATLQQTVDNEIADAPVVSNETPVSILDIQLSEIDGRSEALINERGRMTRELDRLQRTLAETPANAIALESLERDYMNIQAQYNSAVGRMSAAATGERIELLSKGQRISVINSADVPRRPASPNRPLIASAGIAAGLGIGAALVLMLELLNKSIRRPADLSNALGIVPIATLPMVRTPAEIVRRRAMIATLLVVAAVGLPLALFVIHVKVLPLDLLFDRLVGLLPI
jgi:polysaccharide chain length determinant protein (PEP-CTERM system associated)